ncbi:hypothetical protein ScPMuIL_012188 [Solemya velum]
MGVFSSHGDLVPIWLTSGDKKAKTGGGLSTPPPTVQSVKTSPTPGVPLLTKILSKNTVPTILSKAAPTPMPTAEPVTGVPILTTQSLLTIDTNAKVPVKTSLDPLVVDMATTAPISTEVNTTKVNTTEVNTASVVVPPPATAQLIPRNKNSTLLATQTLTTAPPAPTVMKFTTQRTEGAESANEVEPCAAHTDCAPYHLCEADGSCRRMTCKEVHNATLTAMTQAEESGGALHGASPPHCNQNGTYEPVQCKGTQCACVSAAGDDVEGHPKTAVWDKHTMNCPSTEESPLSSESAGTASRSISEYLRGAIYSFLPWKPFLQTNLMMTTPVSSQGETAQEVEPCVTNRDCPSHYSVLEEKRKKTRMEDPCYAAITGITKMSNALGQSAIVSTKSVENNEANGFTFHNRAL